MEKPLKSDLLAAFAPFCALTSETQGKALLYLKMGTSANTAKIDPYAATFELLYDDPQSPGGEFCPWELFSAKDRARALAQFPSKRRDSIASTVGVVWDQMVDDLVMLIERGEMAVVGRIGRSLEPKLSEIPASAWRLFQMEDWENGYAYNPRSDEKLYDVHFRWLRGSPERSTAFPPDTGGDLPTVKEAPANLPSVKRGRPPAADWDAIEILFRSEVERRGGLPEHGGGKGWRTNEDAIALVFEWLQSRKEIVGRTAVGDFVRKMLSMISSEMSEKN